MGVDFPWTNFGIMHCFGLEKMGNQFDQKCVGAFSADSRHPILYFSTSITPSANQSTQGMLKTLNPKRAC